MWAVGGSKNRGACYHTGGSELNLSAPCGGKKLAELMLLCKLLSDFHSSRVNKLSLSPKLTNIKCGRRPRKAFLFKILCEITLKVQLNILARVCFFGLVTHLDSKIPWLVGLISLI